MNGDEMPEAVTKSPADLVDLAEACGDLRCLEEIGTLVDLDALLAELRPLPDGVVAEMVAEVLGRETPPNT